MKTTPQPEVKAVPSAATRPTRRMRSKGPLQHEGSRPGPRPGGDPPDHPSGHGHLAEADGPGDLLNHDVSSVCPPISQQACRKAWEAIDHGMGQEYSLQDWYMWYLTEELTENVMENLQPAWFPVRM